MVSTFLQRQGVTVTGVTTACDHITYRRSFTDKPVPT